MKCPVGGLLCRKKLSGRAGGETPQDPPTLNGGPRGGGGPKGAGPCAGGPGRYMFVFKTAD